MTEEQKSFIVFIFFRLFTVFFLDFHFHWLLWWVRNCTTLNKFMLWSVWSKKRKEKNRFFRVHTQNEGLAVSISIFFLWKGKADVYYLTEKKCIWWFYWGSMWKHHRKLYDKKFKRLLGIIWVLFFIIFIFYNDQYSIWSYSLSELETMTSSLTP